MNQPEQLNQLKELSEKTGIEMIVIEEAEKIANIKAGRFKRQFIGSIYVGDSIKSTISQEFPHAKTVELPGISLLVDADKAEDVVHKLNTRLAYRNCLSFISDDEYREDKKHTVSLICTSDKYNILRLQQVSGGGYIYSTENIIAGLQELEKRYPFEIIGTGADWCLLELKAQPQDWLDLGRQVFKICPSESTIEEYAEGFRRENGKISLWWG
jgi:hypothetical protein